MYQKSLLSKIKFGQTKTAYLLRRGKGSGEEYYIRQRKEDATFPEYHFECLPWAPYIREDEIEITLWGGLSDRRGIWTKNGSRIEVGTLTV